MTTEYTVRLDRAACEGVFACLVRSDRFGEAEDGLVTLAETDDHAGATTETLTVTDDRLAATRQAARACPVEAITVEVVDE